MARHGGVSGSINIARAYVLEDGGVSNRFVSSLYQPQGLEGWHFVKILSSALRILEILLTSSSVSVRPFLFAEERF